MIVKMNWFVACLRLIVFTLWFAFTLVLVRDIADYQRPLWDLIVGYLGASTVVTAMLVTSFLFSRFLVERQIRLSIILQDERGSQIDPPTREGVGLDYSAHLAVSPGATMKHTLDVNDR